MSAQALHSIRRPSGRGTWVALLLLAGGGLGGCGGAVGQVEGQITRQAQAVAGADVVFTQEGQPSVVFYGVSRDDGTYVLDVGDRRGLPPGKYQVLVTEYVLADGGPLPAGEAGAALRGSDEALARRHCLTKEVAVGTNELNLPLEEAQPLTPQG